MNESIKNLGIIVNQILKDNLVLPSNILVPNAKILFQTKNLKLVIELC